MGQLITLTNWTVWDKVLGATRVIRLCDGQGYNHPSAPGFYEPRSAEPVMFLTAISISPEKSAPGISGGGISVKNADAGLTKRTARLPASWSGQNIFDFGLAGHPVEHLYGYDNASYDTFQVLLTGNAASVSLTKEELILTFKDPLKTFSNPLALYTFAGTNTLPTGLEGVTDRKGAHKPVVGGVVLAAPVLQVNTSRDCYQVADTLIYDISAVYQAGVSKTKGSARTFANMDNGSAPTGGTYDYHLGALGAPPTGAYFRLGTTTTSPLTADISGPPHTNLCLRSEALDNAAWTKAACTISADATANSKGVTTADKIVENSSVASHYAEQAVTIEANKVYAASVEVKAAGRAFARVVLQNNAATSGINVDVDLTAGTVATATFGTATAATGAIADLDNGWYRVAVCGVVDAASTSGVLRLIPATALGTVSYLGDGASGIYATRAQIELTAPAEYIATAGSTVTAVKASPADIARDWVEGRAEVTCDYGDIMLMNHIANAQSGFFNRDDINISDALDRIFVGVLGKWYLDNRVFRCFKFMDPEDARDTGLRFMEFRPDATASINDIDVKTWAFQPPEGFGGLTPTASVTVGYAHYWQTQTDGLDASIDPDRRSNLQTEWRYTDPEEDPDVYESDPDALTLRLNTELVQQSDGVALRGELTSLLNVPRTMLVVDCELDAATAARLIFGRAVTVYLPDLGYTTKKFLVVGRQYNAKTKDMRIYLWG